MNANKTLMIVVTTLFFLMCIMATVDTHLFVYPSLSRYLLLEVGMAVISLLAVVACVLVPKFFYIKKSYLFLLFWLCYIWMHYFVTYPHELYRTMYLSLSLFIIFAVSFFLSNGVIKKTHVENVLLIIGLVQITFIAAQLLGVVPSGSTFFIVTGTDENPTVPALYLAGLVPLLITRIAKGKNRLNNFLFLFLCVASVILLRCRTAYVGMVCAIFVLLVMRYKNMRTRLVLSPMCKVLVAMSLVLCALFVGSKMYYMKKDSADGRLLIWKLSVEMAMERPSGYGYGLFEKYYNLKQADYFNVRDFTQRERRNADYVFIPYNDYLEQCIEGGAVGVFFLIMFYVLNIYNAVRLNFFSYSILMQCATLLVE